MIDKELMANLRLFHGSYNILIMLLFIYQGVLGFRIRRERKMNIQSGAVKKHRKLGPVFAILGISGFFLGLALVYLDHGHILKHPLHFTAGLAIAFSIISAYSISRKIKGLESPWRTSHLIRGILVLVLYPVQIALGLGMLLK